MNLQSNIQKKVTLNDSEHDVVFTLNTNDPIHTLNIYCKEIETSDEYWGSFKLTDLQSHYQTIFERIENLYHYISEKTEEIQIESSNRIKIQLNFLKQSKQLNLTLSKMIMCSADQQKCQIERIKSLQVQNQILKNKLNKQGGSGYNKFTIAFGFDTCNTISYRISNLCEISPIVNNYLLNLIRSNNKTQLPKTGIWYFHVLVTNLIKPTNSNSKPILQLGIKSPIQKSVIMVRSNFDNFLYEEEQEIKQIQDSLQQHDFFRLIFNVDLKEMVIQRNFRIFKLLSWKKFKGNIFWPYLRFYLVSGKTDLFLEQENIAWGLVQQNLVEE